MVNDKITLNFEIERGELIAGQSHFSARIRLTNESKNLLREKLGSTIQFDNLDDYFNLNSENFYIYHNEYGDRDELSVKDNNGKHLIFNLPLNHNGFSMELSSDGASIVDYGFYPLYAIYNPNHYNKAQEKVFDDHGELLPITSNMLDNFLSNKNGLTTQDIFLQLQNEAAEKEAKLVRDKRQAEEELDQKNEELKELIEKGDITLFKVVKGNDVGSGRSAVILQLDGEKGDKITLDSSKYYIAEYEDSEFLHCASSGYDMLLDYDGLFFVLNESSYPELESGFYSMPEFNSDSYAKYLNTKYQYFSGTQLSEKLSNELKEDSNQIATEFTIDDEQTDEAVVVESEVKSRKKRAVEEDRQEEEVITSVIDSMEDDKKEDDPKHPLKVKIGEPLEVGKYKVELQVTYDDVKDFYDTIRNKYHASKEYSYEEVMVLYDEIVTPAHSHNYEPFTLDKAYIADGHLFIKGQNFGTLNEFNEMFYKSDELI
ncbi:hypothetical protein [Wolbachia endosymbiont of Cantharis cryptica]|uniref:hypothetical protein n=1 Tax=Wolbachia endosymbiont of Cantharis cryptica TaxID=3066132 RepID=UPI00376ED34F